MRDEDEDPKAHAKSIAWGAVGAGLVYGASKTLAGGSSSAAEDVTDLLHSAYSSSIALSGVVALEFNSEHYVALPKGQRRGDGRVVQMFCHSMGYFFADVILIAGELSIFHRLPHLWIGRLLHHAIQACAVLPCIFRTKSDKECCALRTVLCVAYLAELSNLFLRLSNILRPAPRPQLRKAVNWALLATFASTRILNFWIAVSIFWAARPHVNKNIFRMLTSIQAAGYILNIGWFLKIAQIATRPIPLPSIEC